MPRLELGVVSTFPPREDGIATFTRDLLEGVCGAKSGIAARIAAITDPGSHYDYPRQVQWRIEQGDPESFAEAGRALSGSRVGLVSLQHEFGLFGVWEKHDDPLEDYTPALLETLDKPLVTTFHTVLPQPRGDVRDAMRRMYERSAAVVVMVNTGAKILAEDYGMDAERIITIPHGVPETRPADRERVKKSLRLDGHTVICTFGLLGRSKGIENAIRAMPDVVAHHPDALYLVMGETHPQVRKREGESYRAELTGLARELGMKDHVLFVNKYLEQQTLVRYLQATDIYLTPYLDRNQITSGTLSYALGVGRAIVSTPYIYAAEALAEGRGLLAEFGSPESIARCINMYLDDPEFRRKTEERALAYGREMSWSRVGERYAELFARIARKGDKSP